MYNQEKNNSWFLVLKPIVSTCLVRKLSYRYTAGMAVSFFCKEPLHPSNWSKNKWQILKTYKTWSLTKETTDN